LIRSLLQFALRSFEERSAHLHVQVLAQGFLFRQSAKLGVHFYDLLNPVVEARVLAPQVIAAAHGVSSSVPSPLPRLKR
jgi:hypothetical protein